MRTITFFKLSLKINHLFQAFLLNGIPTIILTLIVFLLNSWTEYRGFTLLPGVEIFQENIWVSSYFFPKNTIEYQIGILATNLILALTLFLSIKNVLKSALAQHKPNQIWKSIRQCTIAIALLIIINLVLG
ncbi:MAG: hypothetical protein ACFBSE_16700 [Prochloraceae cyanobacterium]